MSGSPCIFTKRQFGDGEIMTTIAGMNELHYSSEVAVPQPRTATATIFGWVMGLVGIAIVFLALGAYVGRDLSQGAAITLSLGAIGMLLAGSFAPGLRRGRVGMGWLFATAAIMGLGAGPALQYYVSVERGVVAEAAVGTALTVIAMGALGLTMSKDLVSWMRPLSIAVFIACGVGIVWSLISGPISPVMSLVIFGLSALLLVVDFNFVRKHATEDDVIWIATGIFVSIVNIFFSLLNLLGGD
jgi:modulator of FtsH protease